MKFIITENKRDRFIYNWLTKNYVGLEIYEHEDKPWYLYVDKNGEVIFLYQYHSNELYVSQDLMNYLVDMMYIDYDRIKLIFIDWFPKHYNLKTNKVIVWSFTGMTDWSEIIKNETKRISI